MNSWNPVLNKFVEIKNRYRSMFGNVITECNNGVTCLEQMVEKLQIKEYIDLIKPLQLTQHNNLLLIRYGKYSDVFGGEEDITYDEFWDMYDGFYQECRSVVINIEKDELALTPFKKFRNLNECEENSTANITSKIKNAKCIEFSNKLDGSMQSARWYENKILLAGSMALDANNSWRLKNGYEMLNQNIGYKQLITQNYNFTFIFEYISMKDAHVVNYTKEQEGMYLIGARNTSTGEELSYGEVLEFAKRYNILTTEVYDTSFEKIINTLDKYKSSEKEGFVLNIDGYKVKIKCDDYVNIHRVLSAISSINLIIKNIADDTFDDMLSKIPQAYRDRVLKVADVVFKYISNIDKEVNYYISNAPKENKRNFMVYVTKNVPKNLQSYVREKYLGREVNYIKSHSNTNCPHYKKLKDMGIVNYTDLFKEV